MNVIQRQKSDAAILLKELKRIDPNVHLSGGAPRDWYLNKPCNDFDFYLSFGGALSMEEEIAIITKRFYTLPVACNMLNSFDLQNFALLVSQHGNATFTEDDSEKLMMYTKMPGIRRIYDMKCGTQRFQIITFVDDHFTKNAVDVMSCSICKISWDNEFIPTVDFLVTMQTKVIMKSMQYDWNHKHIQKMLQRFVDDGSYSITNSKN
jgi:hypothetical protein